MLTKQQRDVVAQWLRDDLRRRAHQPEGLYLQVALDALAAYERVAALLDGWSHEDMNGPGWVPSVVVDELRRAVEGK